MARRNPEFSAQDRNLEMRIEILGATDANGNYARFNFSGDDIVSYSGSSHLGSEGFAIGSCEPTSYSLTISNAARHTQSGYPIYRIASPNQFRNAWVHAYIRAGNGPERQFGHWYVEDCRINHPEGTVELSGYDALGKEFDDLVSLEFAQAHTSGTVGSVLHDLCDLLECPFDEDCVACWYADYYIPVLPGLMWYNEGKTYKDVIRDCAIICGGYAKMNRQNELTVRPFGKNTKIDSSDTFTSYENVLLLNENEYFSARVEGREPFRMRYARFANERDKPDTMYHLLPLKISKDSLSAANVLDVQYSTINEFALTSDDFDAQIPDPGGDFPGVAPVQWFMTKENVKHHIGWQSVTQNAPSYWSGSVSFSGDPAIEVGEYMILLSMSSGYLENDEDGTYEAFLIPILNLDFTFDGGLRFEASAKMPVAKGMLSAKNFSAADYTGAVTNEIKTGSTWVDGRPIYSRVIQIGEISKSATEYRVENAFPSNIDLVVSVGGSLQARGMEFPLPRVAGTGYTASLRREGTTLVIGKGTSEAYTGGSIILQYVKTS